MYVDVRKDLIYAVTKIREARGSLSGLSMETILEQAKDHISVRKKDSKQVKFIYKVLDSHYGLRIPGDMLLFKI